MTFSALNISIHFIVLLITLMSGSALALNLEQKTMLKQLTLQEYGELNQEIEEKGLYREAEFYINRAIANVNRRKRNNFFKSINKEIAQRMGIKDGDKTIKFTIPYSLLTTFNLVQAMIYYDDNLGAFSRIIKDNKASTIVTDYAKKLLSKISEQVPETNVITLYYKHHNAPYQRKSIFKSAKNKDFNVQSMGYNPDTFGHLLRNGYFIFSFTAIIRPGNLEDGDEIIFSNEYSWDDEDLSPIRNSASKGREIFIAVNRLQDFLNKRYPNKFRFSFSDDNMFELSLDFVAPYGWWKDAFYRVVFMFDNLGNAGPKIDIEYAPNIGSSFESQLFQIHTYLNSQRIIMNFYKEWLLKYSEQVHYAFESLSIEEQIFYIINCMTTDLEIRTKGILSCDLHGKSAQDVIIQEIINTNFQAQKKVKTPVYIETDRKKIKESVYERIKDGEDPIFDYLTVDDVIDSEFDKSDVTESIRSDIFIPVKMYNEAEVVELDYTTINNFYDLIHQIKKKSGFIIPKDVPPNLYYKNKALHALNFQKVLHSIRKGVTKSKKKKETEENKHKKNDDIVTMIVRVPGYEKQPFELAETKSYTHYIPEHPRHLMHDKITDISEVRKPVKWEIHFFENKKLAKANDMLYEYNLILPPEPQKTTERYRGGSQYGSFPNVWIPIVKSDMSDVEKKFALMSMYDLSRNKFKIPNNLKKHAVSNLGNDIITKALLTPKNDEWLPTQAYLNFLLQRIQMSLLINDDDFTTAKENNVFFENVINGNIDEHVIKDLAFFLGHLTPVLRSVHKMDNPDKIEINYRIVLNYLIEMCVRTLMHNELNASSGIVNQLIEKPEQFSLEDIYASNTKYIFLAFNVLKI
ncbi:hypothetical protein [Endozoicomonas sp. 4G]|uniref:hypothetical protein n=1 Tax=Endozoicomonas sp. 4G TaxID=2872754 RepID=UPI002078A69B|nr:hypothetical protein [Endozoicomonas sp. 4G]